MCIQLNTNTNLLRILSCSRIFYISTPLEYVFIYMRDLHINFFWYLYYNLIIILSYYIFSLFHSNDFNNTYQIMLLQ